MEDFIRRWDEVFRDRIEVIENEFTSKAELNTSKSFKCTPHKICLPKLELRKMWKSSSSSKLQLLTEIAFIDQIVDENSNFDASVVVDERLKSTAVNDDSEIVRIDLFVPANTNRVHSLNNNGIRSAKLLCKVSPTFLIHEFNRRDATKILLKRLKRSLLKNSKKTKKSSGRPRGWKSNDTTASCLSQFASYADADFSNQNGHTKKNDVVSIRRRLKNHF